MNASQEKILNKIGAGLDLTETKSVAEARQATERYVKSIPFDLKESIILAWNIECIKEENDEKPLGINFETEMINAVYANENNASHMLKLSEEGIKALFDKIPKARQVKAEKTRTVKARIAIQGEPITTWVQKDGGTKEVEEYANKGDIILTRVDIDTKKEVLDENGHNNSWKTDKETFMKKYNVPVLSDGSIDVSQLDYVKPKGTEQIFVKIPEAIDLAVKWGRNGSPVIQHIDKEGWLNITSFLEKNNAKSLSDLRGRGNYEDPHIYGIADKEFMETYKINSEIKPKRRTDYLKE